MAANGIFVPVPSSFAHKTNTAQRNLKIKKTLDRWSVLRSIKNTCKASDTFTGCAAGPIKVSRKKNNYLSFSHFLVKTMVTSANVFFVIDSIQEGSRVEFLGTVPLRQRPIIINAVQVALGTLSTIFSLAAIVICLREACLCYGPQTSSQHRRLVNSNSSCNSSHHHKIGANRIGSVPNMNLLTADQSPEGQARAYRLLRWLRQSHHHQQQQQQHQRPPPPLLRRLYSPAVCDQHHSLPLSCTRACGRPNTL